MTDEQKAAQAALLGMITDDERTELARIEDRILDAEMLKRRAAVDRDEFLLKLERAYRTELFANGVA